MFASIAQEADGPSVWRTCAVLLAFFLLLLVGSCVLYRWSEPRGHLPAAIDIAEVESWHSEGFFMEACVYGRYKLDQASVTRLRHEGLGFLQRAGPPAKHSDRYSRWQPTPLIVEEDRRFDPSVAPATEDHVFALSAASCGAGGDNDLESARLKQGSFYALTSNREGLVLIDPKQGRAWFLYFG